MARKSTTRPPGSYQHRNASRVNQPTAETAGLATDDVRKPKPFTVDRHEVPEPRLAWERHGTTSTDDESAHEMTGTPLYTREKINPLTMVEQLRRSDTGVPLNLLDDFNGLPPDANSWEFYQHAGYWQNRLIHGDSAQAMRSLIAHDGLAGQVQMIYFDPPYGIEYDSNFMVATDKTQTDNNATGVPVGDTLPIRAYIDSYDRDIHSFLDGIHERVVLFRELLAESGSLFIQIGDENVHRMAVLVDEVFGPENRVATITWRPTGGSSARTLPESASYLLWYAKDRSKVKYHQLYEPLSRREIIRHFASYAAVELIDGTSRKFLRAERSDPDGTLPQGARIYGTMPLTSQGASNTGRTCEYEYDGVTYHSGFTRHWSVSTPAEQTHSNGLEERASGRPCGLDRLAELGRLHGSGPNGSLRWKQYEDEVPGRRIDNVWGTVMKAANNRYIVQTPNRTIERCLLMATDPGDLVLDPTCGSAATAQMAEHWGRRWITVDVSRVSIAVARRHLLTTVYPWFLIADGGDDPSVGFDHETFQRVSAATLANDEVDLPENTLVLVDRPKENRQRKRLTGAFTIESASPYTWMPFSTADEEHSTAGLGTADPGTTERMLDALRNNAVCDANGHTIIDIQTGDIVPWPHGNLVTHEADCETPGRETRFPAAIMLAAPDVTVTGTQIASAAAEAKRGRSDIEHLIVVGASFEDTASTQVGTVRVHKVMVRRDLAIPGLKNTGDRGALTLLGEPDVIVDWDHDGDLVANLLGYDTFDPTTGGVRSSNGDDVDCWMIDTDHDGTGFFPRLVYLPGYTSNSPQVKRLLKALGRDLDQEAARLLCGSTSQPFPPPRRGNRVVVKIITRTGAEMTTIAALPARD